MRSMFVYLYLFHLSAYLSSAIKHGCLNIGCRVSCRLFNNKRR